MSYPKLYVTLGDTALEITPTSTSGNVTELLPRNRIASVTPVTFQERGVGNTDWPYMYDTITVIRIYMKGVRELRYVDIELQNIQNQPTWSGGTLEDLQTAVADIIDWLPSGVVATPTISVLPSSLSFPDTYEGQESLEDSFVVTGTDLVGSITISFPTGFKGSTTMGGPYSSSDIVLTPSGGTVAGTSIYVVFAPVSETTYSDVISCSSTGATTQDVAVDGLGISSLLYGLTASYSLNGNALKNVGTNNGTATNVTWGSGVWGDSAIFNGTAKVTILDNTDFTLGSNDWAYSILIRRSLSGVREIFSGQSNALGQDPSVSIWIEFTSANKVEVLIRNSTTSSMATVTSVSTIADTNWHNIVAQRVGNNIEIWIDGVLDKLSIPFSTGDSINYSNQPWGIGNAGQLSIVMFTGAIQEVNLWNGRSLTTGEISQLQERYYPFLAPATPETETTAYLAELLSTPSTFNQVIFNQFFKNLKGTGVTGSYNNLNEIDRLWLFANQYQQAARVSMINPSSTTVSEINSPTWTQLRGYNGDTISKYINSNFTPSTDGVNYSQSSASLFVYSLTNSTQNYYEFGAVSSGSPNDNKSFLALRSGAGNAAYPINVNTGIGSPLVSVSDSLGLYHSKLSGTAIELWKNGSLISSDTITPEPLNNIPLFLLCINYYGTALLLSDRQLAVAGTGSGNIDHASFNQAIQNLATSLGFKV